MPKFFNPRDLNFFKTISEEVVDNIIETIIVLYKMNVYASGVTNLYGETLSKVYHAPTKLTAIVERGDTTPDYDSEAGHNVTQEVEFRFNKHKVRSTNQATHWISATETGSVEHLSNNDFGYPEVGDIIGYNGDYYTIGNVREDQIVGGNENLFGGTDTTNSDPDFEPDAKIGIICTTMLSQRSDLQIEERVI